MRHPLLSFILASAVFTSACYTALASSDAQPVSSAFLGLPDKIDAVLERQLPPTETKELLRALIRECCTDPLLQRLEFWIDSLPLDSHEYPDVIQELRSQEAERTSDSAKVQGNHACTTYTVETDEVFSLSGNLNRVDDLFSSYRIANINRDEARRALERHAVPEIVELRVHAKKRIELELKLIDGQWKVREVTVQPLSATLDIPLP